MSSLDEHEAVIERGLNTLYSNNGIVDLDRPTVEWHIRRCHDAARRLYQDLVHLYHGRAWLALNYADWAEFCTRELGSLRLGRRDRQAFVVELRQAGLSVRAIAAAVGASAGTVHGDLGTCSELNTSNVVGIDGKRYAAERPAAEDEVYNISSLTGGDGAKSIVGTAKPPAETKPRRRPITDQARDAGSDLRRVAVKICNILEDDRFEKNRENVIHELFAHLAVEQRSAIVDALTKFGEVGS